MIQILDKKFVPLISKEVIENRIAEIALDISKDYGGQCPLFIVVLNGAFLFASELLKRTPLQCEVTFVKLASYSKTESTGSVREIIGLENSIAGRDIIIIEDIVDTGLTMAQLLVQLNDHAPASIAIATLLHKPDALQTPIEIRYTGFDIDNKFVVGFGLDYDGIGRNLDSIYVLA
jgi:hypoxanthine phosphoribosyltransferase